MEQRWVRAGSLHGTLDIEPRLSLVQTAGKLSEALGTLFVEETSGQYEEYPAYVAEGAGIEFALLGTPLPEYDVREHKSANHQLMITSSPDGEKGDEEGEEVPDHWIDVSALYARLIQKRTGLLCVALEFPGAS